VPAIGLTRGELISAVSAALLLVLMFAVAWYGVDGIPGRPDSRGGLTGAETGWEGLSVVRWMMLLTVALAFVAVAVHVGRPARQAVAAVRLGLLGLSAVTALLVVVRVLIDLPSPQRVVDQKLGGVLGVAAALGIAFGAFDAVREQRERMRSVPYLSTAPGAE
jgi:hypothetical protein